MIASSPLCGTGRRGLALRVVSVAVLVVAAAAVGVWLASPVRAHSFLASTNPEEGARLSRAPAAVALQFSERVAASSVDISVRTAGGDVVQQPVPRMESGGHVARLPLSDVARGVYVVSWQVTSAVDGHESAGEFAFAVGDVAGSDVPLSAVALVVMLVLPSGLRGRVQLIVAKELLDDDAEDEVGEVLGGLGLHAGQHVGVRVQREGGRVTPEEFGEIFGLTPACNLSTTNCSKGLSG